MARQDDHDDALAKRPLSLAETDLVSAFATGLVEALRDPDLATGIGDRPDRWWWRLANGLDDQVTVTEVATHWRGVGREVPLATFGGADRAMLWFHMSTEPGGTAGSLIALSLTRDLLAVRFDRFKKKTTIRFLVGEPGLRASSWRVWAGTESDDIYVGDRQSTKYGKFSLHQSGEWRYAWTPGEPQGVVSHSPTGEQPEVNRSGGHFVRWREPATPESGWLHALSIFATSEDVVEIPGDHQKWDETIRIPPPPKGWMVEVALFIVTPDKSVFDASGMLAAEGAEVRLLGGYLLPGGRTAVFLAITRPISVEMLRMLDIERFRAQRRHEGTTWSLDPRTGPRTFAITAPGDEGFLEVWDLALVPPPEPRGLRAFKRPVRPSRM